MLDKHIRRKDLTIKIVKQKPLETKYNKTALNTKPQNNTFFTNLKTILFFNPLFGRKDYNFGFGQERFNQLCEVSNCFTTNNRSLLGKNKLLHCISFEE